MKCTHCMHLQSLHWSIDSLPCVCFVCIHTLLSVVIGLGSVVCRLWLCLPPSHLWLPVARGFTSFHNSHVQKDIGLQTPVTLDHRHAALEVQSQKRITAFSQSRHYNVYFPFPPHTLQVRYDVLHKITQNWTHFLCSVYPPMCTCV